MQKGITFHRLWHFLVLASFVFGATLVGCKKDNDNPNGGSSQGKGKYLLQIENGAKTILPDQSFTYTARVINESGASSAATSVTWSSSTASVADISASGVVTAKGIGQTTITAKVNLEGREYTASVPLQIAGTPLFTVGPAAILCDPGFELQFESFLYTGTGPLASNKFTYSIDKSSVATVSASGAFKAVAPGTATITVKAQYDGDPVVLVPVLVVGVPEVTLPVVRVQVTPGSASAFKGDTKQFTAKAFNGNNQQVTETFTWKTTNSSVATIDQNGLVTCVGMGEVTIQAIAKGVIGEAYLEVYPDTMVVIEPFYASVAPGKTKQFTAKVYNAKTNTVLSGVPLTWELPTFPAGFDILNIGTVSSTGLVTVKTDAIQGNASTVVCYVTGKEYTAGGAMVMVGVQAGDDCGSGNPAVASITVAEGNTINLSVTSNPSKQLTVAALDALGNPVTNPELRYSSDNAVTCTVDSNGFIAAAAPGTAIITICSGNYAQKQITVNVSF